MLPPISAMPSPALSGHAGPQHGQFNAQLLTLAPDGASCSDSATVSFAACAVFVP
jgi:hypothetical protein